MVKPKSGSGAKNSETQKIRGSNGEKTARSDFAYMFWGKALR